MSTPSQQRDRGKRTAGAFDVRIVIAGLIGFYGVVLIITGIVSKSGGASAKTGGVNANLWSGLVMVVMALGFAVWTWLRPVVVDENALAEAHAELDENRPGAH